MERLIFPLSPKEAEKLGKQVNAEDNKNALFPTRLRMLRSLRRLSQAELAIELDVTKSSIGLYEVGDNVPDVKTLSRIAKFFHVSADWLIAPDEKDPVDEDLIVSCKVTGLNKETVKTLQANKESNNRYIYHLIDMFIADSTSFDYCRKETGCTQEEYDDSHSGLLLAFWAYITESHNIAAERLIKPGDTEEMIKYFNEIAEIDRLTLLQKSAMKFKKIRNDKIIKSIDERFRKKHPDSKIDE